MHSTLHIIFTLYYIFINPSSIFILFLSYFYLIFILFLPYFYLIFYKPIDKEIKKQQQQQLKELQQQIYIQQQQQLKLKQIQKLRQERKRSDQTAAILSMQRQRKVGVVQNNLVPCTTVQEHEAEDVNFLMVENPWKQSPGKMSSSN